MAAGLFPYRGNVTDTRAYLAIIEPKVIELIPGEYVDAYRREFPEDEPFTHPPTDEE